MRPSTDRLIRQEVEARGLVVRVAQEERELLAWEDFFADFYGPALGKVAGGGLFGELANMHARALARVRRQERRRRRTRWASWLLYLRHRRVL